MSNEAEAKRLEMLGDLKGAEEIRKKIPKVKREPNPDPLDPSVASTTGSPTTPEES